MSGKQQHNDEQAVVFKACPHCGQRWASYAEFLKDPEVRLLGFQPGANGHLDGFFLFHHQRCDTSLALQLPAFQVICSLPMQATSKCSTGRAPEFCVAAIENRPCPPLCVCEFVSSVMQTIEAWPKQPALF